jgi:hypothetical protein
MSVGSGKGKRLQGTASALFPGLSEAQENTSACLAAHTCGILEALPVPGLDISQVI